MRSRKAFRLAGLVLLGLLGLCTVACAALSLYQAACQFEVAPGELTIQAGNKADLSLYQWDCVLSYLGFHACYEVAQAQVEDLPPGSSVEGDIEWLGCHESRLTLAIGRETPPGTYQLTVRPSHGWASVEKVTLTVTAP